MKFQDNQAIPENDVDRLALAYSRNHMPLFAFANEYVILAFTAGYQQGTGFQRMASMSDCTTRQQDRVNLGINDEVYVVNHGRLKIIDIYVSHVTEDKVYNVQCPDGATMLLTETDFGTGPWNLAKDTEHH